MRLRGDLYALAELWGNCASDKFNLCSDMHEWATHLLMFNKLILQISTNMRRGLYDDIEILKTEMARLISAIISDSIRISKLTENYITSGQLETILLVYMYTSSRRIDYA
jgi:hypothetical protein